MDEPLSVMTIVGARPQFVKASVVARALDPYISRDDATHTLVHTGQHYDDTMSSVFFDELSIPRPDLNLAIQGGSHGAMTGRMLSELERVMLELRPDWVLVYGDTNSTLAGALAATKLGVRVAHVEAGLRSFNRTMPEEINRVLTDHASDLLFAPTDAAIENLRREGIDGDHVVRCGDVMYDASIRYKTLADERSTILVKHGLERDGFALATVHRQENTDDPDRLGGIVRGLVRASERIRIVLPLHPRTRDRLERADLLGTLFEHVSMIDPVGYIDMIALESGARLILTDSGGVQKEAFFHGVVCVTLRDETEWIELIEHGANTLVGADPDRIDARVREILEHDENIEASCLYGEGASAHAIVERIVRSHPAHAS